MSEGEPEPEPADVAILSVDAAERVPGGWDVRLELENTGGEGKLKVQFESEGCTSTSSPVTIPAGATWDREWHSGCEVEPFETATLIGVEGEYVETDRAPIPGS